MNSLIKIEINNNHDPVVSARELYEKLDVGSRYNDWIFRMFEYGFVENEVVLISKK